MNELKDIRKVMFEKTAAPDPQRPMNFDMTPGFGIQTDRSAAQNDPAFYNASHTGAYSSDLLNRGSDFIQQLTGMFGFPISIHGDRQVLGNQAQRLDPRQYADDIRIAMQQNIPRPDGYTFGLSSDVNKAWQAYVDAGKP